MRTDRGIDALRSAVDGRGSLDLVLVESDLKATARALASLVDAPRREADVAARPVEDAHRLLVAFRLRAIDWTIVPFVFEPGSPWNVEHVSELAAAGQDVSAMARAIAGETGSRVLHLRHDGYTIYAAHGSIETRPADAMDEELSALGVLVPPLRVRSDGLHVQLELFGIEPADVERVDVVVLRELGDPAVDRGVAPASAPALVGVPAVLSPDAPALVQTPPPVSASLGPEPSEAPPLVREPPPIVEPSGPAASEAEPLVREPPPLVDVPDAPTPPPDAPPPVAEPPLVTAPRKSEAPPLVHPPPAASPPDEPPSTPGSSDDG